MFLESVVRFIYKNFLLPLIGLFLEHLPSSCVDKEVLFIEETRLIPMHRMQDRSETGTCRLHGS